MTETELKSDNSDSLAMLNHAYNYIMSGTKVLFGITFNSATYEKMKAFARSQPSTDKRSQFSVATYLGVPVYEIKNQVENFKAFYSQRELTEYLEKMNEN